MGADRSALTALGGVAVLLVVLAATTVGGLRPVSVGTTTSQHDGRSGEPAAPWSGSGAGHDVTGDARPPSSLRPPLGLSWLPTWGRLVAIVALACLVLAALASLRVRSLRRRRPPPPRTPATPGPAEEPAGPESAALRELLAQQLSRLDDGTPRNAIVASWVQLEEFAAGHGTPRLPADTPAEFAVRALAAYRLDPDALERLADLYREARFSAHEMGEADRDEARACLLSLTGAGAPS